MMRIETNLGRPEQVCCFAKKWYPLRTSIVVVLPSFLLRPVLESFIELDL